MNYPPFRAFISFWLIVCMLFSFAPLGCHSAKVRHATGWPGQPQLPEYTAQQLEECGELIQEGIDPVRHPVDAKVVLDENGHVLDVTTAGEPNPDVGMCIRVALRGMKVDKDVIHEAMLRRPPSLSSWPNAETQPNPKYLGEVVIVTVVVVVFTEVIIETVAVALGVAVTATVVAEATKAAQAKAAQAKAAQAAKRAPAPDNYRGRYMAERHTQGKPRLPDDWDVHHRIPQKYMDHPGFKDFDFHQPSNLQGVKGGNFTKQGQNVHARITKDWEDFGRRSPNATKAQIEEFAKQMDAKYANDWFK